MDEKTIARLLSMAGMAFLSKRYKTSDVEVTLLSELGYDEPGFMLTVDNEEFIVKVEKTR